MSPDFDELMGGADLAPEERARLQRVHDLLLAAGPPPELPAALRVPPSEKPANAFPLFPKRRRAALVALAAALALVAFGGGYLTGDRTTGLATDRIVQMFGTEGAVDARASIELFEADASGNWPMLMTIRGLEPLPAGETYELWLTENGRPAKLCGVFTVHAGATEVWMNAPWKLKRFDGWIVARTGSTEPLLAT